MGGGLKAPNWLIGMWKDSHYQSELKKRWAELRSGVWHTKTMDAYLDSMKTYLKNAADRNFKRWPNLGQASGQNDADPEPMKYCTQSSGGFGMAMGGYNATTWDGEVEHLRKKMKEQKEKSIKDSDFLQIADEKAVEQFTTFLNTLYPDMEAEVEFK